MSLDDALPGIQTADERERALLAPYAFHSRDSLGRKHEESSHPYRNPHQRDRDRILHSSAFRRLSDKMQVFTGDMGDYHRTRLTHTMEVASIARTIARALRLNEDFVEALALLHDIGHPPYGHAGEDAIHEHLADEGGFTHNQFALTLVEEIEQPYAAFPGLNLTREVLAGQSARVDKSDCKLARFLEVQVVDAADSITYNAHDVDDAVKLGLVELSHIAELPVVGESLETARSQLGEFADDERQLRPVIVRDLLNRQVGSLLSHCGPQIAAANWSSAELAAQADFRIGLGDDLKSPIAQLEKYLYKRVYRHDELLRVRSEAQSQIREMVDYFSASPDQLPTSFQQRATKVGKRRAAADYVAGMTDRFCRQTYDSMR